MSDSLIELAYQLTRAGRPFVLATVVWCERPTSAKPGAQAIIQEDGQFTGWVGGSCTQPVVLREAKRLLREGGEPFLLRLSQDPPGDSQPEIQGPPALPSHAHTEEYNTHAHRPGDSEALRRDKAGMRVFPMTCTSGGALEIYMEPHLPQPRLLLIGESPILVALHKLAQVLDFAVNQLDETGLEQMRGDEHTYIVIATHGQYDEPVLERVLTAPAAYIGMVSSPRRAEVCRAYLRAAGMAEAQIARIKAPAGLDIGAHTPEEIAASILAELVQRRRRSAQSASGKHGASAEAAPTQEQTGEAIDPVCGMTVEIAGARHTSAHAGRTYYFCCPACKRQFEREPERFLAEKGT